jgi:pimeloyl-ACP methyl ester carboxylesterase
VATLVAAGYQLVVIDSRGHGRGTRDERPYSYELMGSDVLAVLDELAIPRARWWAGATARVRH